MSLANVLIPILYLKGISTGDFEEVLAALVGKNAPGLSASTIARLKEGWTVRILFVLFVRRRLCIASRLRKLGCRLLHSFLCYAFACHTFFAEGGRCTCTQGSPEAATVLVLFARAYLPTGVEEGRVTQSGSFPTGAAKCTQTSWRDWCHSRRPKADRESRGKCTMIWIPAFAGMTIDIARLSRCHSDERGQTHAGCVICPRGSSESRSKRPVL